jgi:hypothetical protein
VASTAATMSISASPPSCGEHRCHTPRSVTRLPHPNMAAGFWEMPPDRLSVQSPNQPPALRYAPPASLCSAANRTGCPKPTLISFRTKRHGQHPCRDLITGYGNHLRSAEGLPNCQYIRTARIDAAVVDAFLTALAPAELDALSRARRTQVQMDTALRASAESKLERKRYAAALAERQFNRVDPDNRLVAAELERRWEMALSEVRAAEGALTPQTSAQTIAHMGIGNNLQARNVSTTLIHPGSSFRLGTAGLGSVS